MTQHASAAITSNGRLRPQRVLLAIGVATLSLTAGVGTANAATATTSQTTGQKTAKAVTRTTTVTAPSKTETETKTITQSKTEAPRTETKTRTKTVSETKPGGVSIRNSKSLKINATQTTPAKSTDDGGLPWWAWVLIGIAVVAVGAGMFAAGHHRGKTKNPQSGPDTRSGSPPPGSSPPPPSSDLPPPSDPPTFE